MRANSVKPTPPLSEPLSESLKAQALRLFTRAYLPRANRLMGRKGRALSVLSLAGGHISRVGVKGLMGQLEGIVRMLKLSIQGQYPTLPWRTAVALLAGILYLVSPIDLIPDFIPALGLLDDIFILTKLATLATRDLEDFLRWEAEAQTSASPVKV